MGVFIQEEDASGGDQDQEERRWNKRTQQMLHGLQVREESPQERPHQTLSAQLPLPSKLPVTMGKQTFMELARTTSF